MARARSGEAAKARSKATGIEDVNRGIERLHALMAQIEDFSREGFPYRDAVRARTELALRETIRRIFGERSPEYQHHKDHKIRATHRVQSSPSVLLIKQLITTLEQQRNDLLGLPSAAPDTGPEATDVTEKPLLHLVPTPEKTDAIGPGTLAEPPESVSAQPLVDQADSTDQVDSSAAAPHPAPGVPRTRSQEPAPVQSSATESSQAPQGVQATPAADAKTPPLTASPPASPLASQPEGPSLSSDMSGVPVMAVDPVEALRKICARFHLVARQLRLRRDGRPTLEVEDELDVQDLIGALLRLDFDDVQLDERNGGTERTAIPCGYHLHDGRVIVIARKTRSGVTIRELSEQIKNDAAYYASQVDCRLLLCFVYDPEGRIGNPRAFESDLTTVSDGYTFDVVVAPK